MLKDTWTVKVGKRAFKNVPESVLESLQFLISELEYGPETPNWSNYCKLNKYSYHCHLKRGRPTYVACWTADKTTKTIEVYYVGTHEKAPY